MRKWIDCPICGESDTRAETEGDGYLVYCKNLACASNQLAPFDNQVEAARNGQSAAMRLANDRKKEVQATWQELQTFREAVAEYLTSEQIEEIDRVMGW